MNLKGYQHLHYLHAAYSPHLFCYYHKVRPLYNPIFIRYIFFILEEMLLEYGAYSRVALIREGRLFERDAYSRVGLIREGLLYKRDTFVRTLIREECLFKGVLIRKGCLFERCLFQRGAYSGIASILSTYSRGALILRGVYPRGVLLLVERLFERRLFERSAYSREVLLREGPYSWMVIILEESLF